jgi:hypothetical protein
LTDNNGSTTVGAGDIVVGAVNATNAITQNMDLDVAGVLSDYSQVQLFNAAPLVWAPNGTTIPTTVAMQVLGAGGTGITGGSTTDPSSSGAFLALEGPLGLYISGSTYSLGTVNSDGGFGNFSQSEGFVQIGADGNISGAMTPNNGIFLADEPSGYSGSYTVGSGLHMFASAAAIAATGTSGSNAEWNDLGKEGLVLNHNAANSGNNGNLDIFDGGNINIVDQNNGGGNITLDDGSIETVTGNVVAGGYLRTGAANAPGTACPIYGAFGLNNATGQNLLFCNSALVWVSK